MRILCVGISHKTAAVELREKLAMDATAAAAALRALARRWPEAEFVVLSTCNRTELCCARPLHGHPRVEDFADWLAERAGRWAADATRSIYMLEDASAVRHLFAVAAGLDSMVLGEGQITSQVKDAYEQSAARQRCGPVLGELFRTALHVAKHVKSETPVAAGKVSIASAAIDAAVASMGDLTGKCVLAIGAGKMSSLMLRRLGELGAAKVLVANRTLAKARALAAECGGQAVPLRALAEHLPQADIVLSSTGSRRPVLTRALVGAAQRRRRGRPLLLIDIAMPRDIEPQAARVRGVTLLNLDDLQRVVLTSVRARHRNLVAAEAIIAQHVAQIVASLNIRQVAPTLEALSRRMTAIAETELAAARNKLASHADAEEDLAILQRVLHRTIRQILHPPMQQLRRTAGTDAASAHVAALCALFDLDPSDRR